jgi:hypothetical protein
MNMPFILTIRERSHSWAGRPPVRSEHASRAGAQAELLDYVRRNWDAEMGTEAPGEPGKMIEEYFSEVLEGYDIVEAGIPRMTLAEFRATRKPCDATKMEACGYIAGERSSGYVYVDALVIENTDESWPVHTGAYYLRIANDERQSNDLAELERILYHYAIAEQLIVPRGEHE